MTAETNIDGTLSLCRPTSARTNLPVKDEGPSESSKSTDITWIWIIIPTCIIVPLIVAIIFWAKTNCPRNQNRIVDTCRLMTLCSLMTNRDCERDLEYANKNRLPTAPPFDDNGRPPNPPLYSEICQSVEQEANQTALPFSNPCYATNCSAPIYAEDPDEEVAEHDILIPEPIPENEETMPSSWTPNPDTANVDSASARLTFENSIPNLQQLEISQPDGAHRSQPSSSSSGASSGNSSPRNNTTGNHTNTAPNESQHFGQTPNVTQTQINININSANVFQGQFS